MINIDIFYYSNMCVCVCVSVMYMYAPFLTIVLILTSSLSIKGLFIY